MKNNAWLEYCNREAFTMKRRRPARSAVSDDDDEKILRHTRAHKMAQHVAFQTSICLPAHRHPEQKTTSHHNRPRGSTHRTGKFSVPWCSLQSSVYTYEVILCGRQTSERPIFLLYSPAAFHILRSSSSDENQSLLLLRFTLPLSHSLIAKK